MYILEPGSVADANLMHEHQFKALLHRTSNKRTLEQCKAKLNTLQCRFIAKGKFKTVVRNQMCGKPATFIIVKGRINTPPPLIKNTFIELGTLKI